MKDNKLNYNYIVLGSEDEYYKVSYSDINLIKGCAYLSAPMFGEGVMGRIFRGIHRVHMSPRLNKLISLPLKNIWNKCLLKNVQISDKPYCFLFFSAGPFTEHIPYGLIDYLKNRYKNCKIAVFYQDLVEHKRTNSIDDFKTVADVIFSFDYADAEKYSLIYHNLIYSRPKANKTDEYSSDIYFCGAVKNRWNEIYNAYKFFVAAGFHCDFIIVSDDEKLREKYKKCAGLQFVSTFSYYENLEHVRKTKNMLEIMQKNGTGYTIRACEAIAYNKRLITNNQHINRADFYSAEQFVSYDEIEKINTDEIRIPFSAMDQTNIMRISPVTFVDEIDKILANYTA